MPKNPKWTTDELILALDLYFRINPIKATINDIEIVNLSNILKMLPIHFERPDKETYRNPNSVCMKLLNFSHLDPHYDGVGLKAGSKLDEIIWNEYSHDHLRLKNTAEAILRHYRTAVIDIEHDCLDDVDEFPEGKMLYRVHKARERNTTMVKKKKELSLRNNSTLSCEICSCDFEKTYGDIGKGYIECHHKIPVSELEEGSKTKLTELILVCSNCHRMLHRTRPWLSDIELKLKMPKIR